MLTVNTNASLPIYNYRKNNNRNVNFTATPAQIFEKLEYAKICPGKKGFLTELANYFDKLQNKMTKSKKLPESFDYFLTKENVIPEKLANTKVRTGFLSWTSFKKLDKRLNEKSFHCSGESHCTCGKGKSLAQFTSELLEHIGAPQPNKITINKGAQ